MIPNVWYRNPSSALQRRRGDQRGRFRDAAEHAQVDLSPSGQGDSERDGNNNDGRALVELVETHEDRHGEDCGWKPTSAISFLALVRARLEA